MYVAFVFFALHVAIAANALPGFAALLHLQAYSSTVAVAGGQEPLLALPSGALVTVFPAGLLITPFGAPLFGIVGTIILVMFLITALSPSGRSRRSSSRLGLAIGILALVILMMIVNVAMP